MAETGFTPSQFVAAPAVEKKDVFSERSEPDGTRVEPSQKPDNVSDFSNRSAEERAAEIERFAEEALKQSRLSIERDDQNGDFVYIMVDDETGEEVRRWPPEKHSDLMNYLMTRTAGLIDKTA